MKRVAVLALTLTFLGVSLPQAKAWIWDKKDKAAQTEKQPTEAKKDKSTKAKQAEEPQAKADKAQEEARKAKRLLIEQRRKEIDNIEWELQLVPLAGKGKALSETAIFKDRQVSFVEFGKKGFNPSNFSLKIQEDDIIVWETMQTAEKSGVIFWRGEINPDLQKMRGVISHQISDKKKEDYSFVSTSRKSTVKQE
jgi:hypothetical protein